MKVILFYFLLYNGNTTDGMGELTLFNHDEVLSLLIYLGVSAFQGRWDWDVLCKILHMLGLNLIQVIWCWFETESWNCGMRTHLKMLVNLCESKHLMEPKLGWVLIEVFGPRLWEIWELGGLSQAIFPACLFDLDEQLVWWNRNFSIHHCLDLVFYSMRRLSTSNDQAQLAFLNNWLDTHIHDAQYILRKPLLLAEFGKSWKDPGFNSYQRDTLFNSVYYKIYSSAKRGGPAAGGLFWQLLTEGIDSFRDGYEIILSESPSTANVIAQQSHRLYQLQKIYARLRNIQRWKRARAIRRAQWWARNRGRNIGNWKMRISWVRFPRDSISMNCI